MPRCGRRSVHLGIHFFVFPFRETRFRHDVGFRGRRRCGGGVLVVFITTVHDHRSAHGVVGTTRRWFHTATTNGRTTEPTIGTHTLLQVGVRAGKRQHLVITQAGKHPLTTTGGFHQPQLRHKTFEHATFLTALRLVRRDPTPFGFGRGTQTTPLLDTTTGGTEMTTPEINILTIKRGILTT